MASRAATLTANVDFRRFWWGQAASTTGDAFAMVAMPLLVLEETGSVTQMGYVTALAAAAQIATSLVAGVVVDRAHRRALMIACDVGRLLLYASVPLAWWAGAPSVALLYLVAGAAAALGNLFQVAYVAAVANIVSREELGVANSRLQATQALTYAVGPMLAGLVCARFGAETAMMVDAASFVVSAASLAAVRFRQERAEREQGPPAGGAFAEVLIGVRFLAGEPVLRAMVAVLVSVAFLSSAGLSAAIIDIVVYHLRHDLSESSLVVGVCLGASAFGALVGALAAPRIRDRFGFGASFLGGTLAQAIGLLVVGAVPSALTTILGGMVWASGLTLRGVVALSLRQELTPDSLIGRVTAASWTLTFAASAIGAVLVTHGAAAVGAERALLVTSALLGVVVAAGTRTEVGRAVPEVETGRISRV